MEELTQLIGNTGFPIVIALYTMIRLETTLKSNTEAINKMSVAIGGKTNE